MISYKFLSVTDKCPARGYWDQALLEDMFKDSYFTEEEGDGSIVVLPGAGQKNEVKAINKELSKYKWAVLIVTSDEESQFPVEQINHPNIKIYVQYPKNPRHDQYGKWPLGYTPHTRDNLKLVDKDLDWAFSGQITHKRREEMRDQLQKVPYGWSNYSSGFSEGVTHEEYIVALCRAKVAPAPAGPVSADSFRTYEALEAGAIPIADNISQAGDKDFWEYLIGPVPFPTINNYRDLPGYIKDQLDHFQHKANMIQAWWIDYKYLLKTMLLADIKALSGDIYYKPISVVIPVSPIKSHPSTEILEKCVASIKHHLPDAQIFITFDGVREEQEDRRKDYEEFTRRALFLCNTEWYAYPLLFDEHTHQVGMMKEVIKYITTPTILYVEGDTGLVTDHEIDWKYCVDKIVDGTSNMIRFHYQGHMDKEHEPLMLETDGLLRETVQWSQRPHLASTAYYKRILREHFSMDAKSFIEDKMHGIVMNDWRTDGRLGWHQHRLHIYCPQDGYLKRSEHFDGRDDGPKWDESQVF